MSANAIAQKFRSANPPIIGRIHNDRFLLDLRCIFNVNDLIPQFGSSDQTIENRKSRI
jgi:L-seryl-tRNA(Ser) seleniumtransferase